MCLDPPSAAFPNHCFLILKITLLQLKIGEYRFFPPKFDFINTVGFVVCVFGLFNFFCVASVVDDDLWVNSKKTLFNIFVLNYFPSEQACESL